MPIKRTYQKNGKTIAQFFGRVTINGKRYEKKCPNKTAAKEWEILVRQKLKELSGNVSPVSYSVHSLLQLYLDACKSKGFSHDWITEKKSVFESLCKRIPPETPVNAISYLDISQHLDAIAETVSGYRANRTRRHIVAAYNWGIKALGLPAPCPWVVDNYKEERTPRRIPSKEEFWKVANAASDEKRRLLLTFLYTAARKNEIFTLTWNDIDFERRVITLWTNKRAGGKEYDVVPMVDLLYGVLQEQRKITAFQKHVFINPETDTYYREPRRVMERLCKAAAVDKFGFHSIRHHTASILADEGVDITTIQAILRHKTAATTSKYLHSLNGKPGMAKRLNNVFNMSVVSQKENPSSADTEKGFQKKVNE